MSGIESTTQAEAVNLARESLYRFLAAVLGDPLKESSRLALDPASQCLACHAADLLREEAGTTTIPLGFGELPPQQLDLNPVVRALQISREEFTAEYDRVFGLVLSRECPPYETEYHPTAETFFRSQQLADIAGFYRAYGLQVSHSHPERVDHVALELEFMAVLLLKQRIALGSQSWNPESAEQAAVCEDTQRAFFRDHLAWWLSSFATGLARKAGTGPYAAVGRVLAAFLPTERQRLGVALPRLPLQPTFIERPEEQAGCAGCGAENR
jgi:TorA maturation chaperone TorD